MIDETALTALVRQSMEPTEAEESRAAVVRLADEIRRLWKHEPPDLDFQFIGYGCWEVETPVGRYEIRDWSDSTSWVWRVDYRGEWNRGDSFSQCWEKCQADFAAKVAACFVTNQPTDG